jgi:hypothetical protein
MEYGDGSAHISVLYDLKDAQAASAKYESLCKQISTATLPLAKGGTPLRLTTKDPLKPVEMGKSITTFTLSPVSSKYGMVSVMVVLLQDKETDNYKVILAVGDDFAVEDWLSGY